MLQRHVKMRIRSRILRPPMYTLIISYSGRLGRLTFKKQLVLQNDFEYVTTGKPFHSLPQWMVIIDMQISVLVSQARPNQPQRGSLSVSRTGKEGSGDSR